MRLFLVSLFFLMVFVDQSYGQAEVVLENRDGVILSYKLVLKESDDKKDKYILFGKVVNTNTHDLYYSIKLLESKETYLPMTSSSFASIKLRNSTGLLGATSESFSGLSTNFQTTDNYALYKLEQGAIITEEFTFTVKSGEIPLITSEFNQYLRKIGEFNLKVNAEMLSGNYMSNCGNINISLSFVLKEGKEILLQTSNGKQFEWLRTSETTFTRFDGEFTLSYQKDNSFIFSISDGTTCKWTK